MAVPVTEKDALRKQFMDLVERTKADLLLQHPALHRDLEETAQTEVLAKFGVEDYILKMSALEAEKEAIELKIRELNVETINKITGNANGSGVSTRLYYGRGRIDMFEEYPDEVRHRLKLMTEARKRELLRETATGRRFMQLEQLTTEFNSALTLCSTHKQLKEIWDTHSQKLGTTHERELSRINISRGTNGDS